MPPKNSGTFNYIGGKTTIAPWIIDHFPDHEVYVEPFGGSASVLMRKPQSPVEVYNDTNSDCVTFFEAVKRRPDDLKAWINTTPYSRELFDRWLTEWHAGERPDDIVEHAGRFLYLTKASFGGKLFEGSGTFSVHKSPGADSQYGPTKWKRVVEQVEHVKSRFDYVQVEHADFQNVIERYDAPETFFYCDPPYMDVGDGYYETHADVFDHGRFAETLIDCEGKWLVSYDHHIPKTLQDYNTVSRTKESTVGRVDKVETLTMNYDCDGETVMSELGQQNLEAYTDGGQP